MRQLVLNIREQHIASGVQATPDKCAAALALRDAGYAGANVEHYWIHRKNCDVFAGSHVRTCARTPRELAAWLSGFDESKEGVRPARFLITLPEGWPGPEERRWDNAPPLVMAAMETESRPDESRNVDGHLVEFSPDEVLVPA